MGIMDINHDPLVNTKVSDESIVQPNPEPTKIGFSYLQPFFSNKGEDNVIKEFDTGGLFDLEYGEIDLKKYKRFGHAQLIARQILRGNGKLSACRLLPSDAVAAKHVVGTYIRTDKVDIEQYEKTADGTDYKLDPNGDKILTGTTEKGVYAFSGIRKYDETKSDELNLEEVSASEYVTSPVSGDLTYHDTTNTISIVDSDNNTTEITNFTNLLDSIMTSFETGATTYSVTKGENIATKEYTFYPLFIMKNKSRGICGNDIGISLNLDSKRDGKRSDGRRHTMVIYKKNKKGLNTRVGSSREGITFSFNPDAVTLPGSDSLDSLDVSYDDYKNRFIIPTECVFNESAFDMITEELEDYVENPVDLDFISFLSEDREILDTIRVDKTSELYDDLSNINYLMGGTDGSIDPKYIEEMIGNLENNKTFGEVDGTDNYDIEEVTGSMDGSDLTFATVSLKSNSAIKVDVSSGESPFTDLTAVVDDANTKLLDGNFVKTLTREVADSTKTLLLQDFYRGKIDNTLFDYRLVQAGITLDAWFPMEVKETMLTEFQVYVRNDIQVWLDGGPNADTLDKSIDMYDSIAGKIDTETGNVKYNVHSVGHTTDRARSITTSGNYEVAYGLPTLFNQSGSFTVYSGFFSGKVKCMKFPYYPKVVRNDIQISPLRKKNLFFAMRLNNSNDLFFMSDDSQYSNEYSVLGSSTNLLFVGSVKRTLHIVAAKYDFYPGSALESMDACSRELTEVLEQDWFNDDMKVNFSIYQTRNDKIEGEASIDFEVTFKNTIQKYNGTIKTKRQPLE